MLQLFLRIDLSVIGVVSSTADGIYVMLQALGVVCCCKLEMYPTASPASSTSALIMTTIRVPSLDWRINAPRAQPLYMSVWWARQPEDVKQDPSSRGLTALNNAYHLLEYRLMHGPVG